VATLRRDAGWKIAVYGGEHGVPHFHIEGPGYRCSVGIATLQPIIGSVPRPVLRAARAWAGVNQALLTRTWRELNR
jgi:hypothetical protein